MRLSGLGLGMHQNQKKPADNKFHRGNGDDGSPGKGTGRHIACFVLQ